MSREARVRPRSVVAIGSSTSSPRRRSSSVNSVPRDRNRLMKVASTVASMRGTRSACCPVISMMSRTAVIGARAAPAKTAPMPITPKTPAAGA